MIDLTPFRGHLDFFQDTFQKTMKSDIADISYQAVIELVTSAYELGKIHGRSE